MSVRKQPGPASRQKRQAIKQAQRVAGSQIREHLPPSPAVLFAAMIRRRSR